MSLSNLMEFKKRGDEMMEERELPCVNEKCKYYDHTFDQNCAAMITDAKAPYLPYCRKYNCAVVIEMNNPNQIDYTALYRAYYARRRRWHSGISPMGCGDPDQDHHRFDCRIDGFCNHRYDQPGRSARASR